MDLPKMSTLFVKIYTLLEDMKSLVSKLTSAYLLGLALATLLPTFYCKVNNPLQLRQTLNIPSSLPGCGSVLLRSRCLSHVLMH